MLGLVDHYREVTRIRYTRVIFNNFTNTCNLADAGYGNDCGYLNLFNDFLDNLNFLDNFLNDFLDLFDFLDARDLTDACNLADAGYGNKTCNLADPCYIAVSCDIAVTCDVAVSRDVAVSCNVVISCYIGRNLAVTRDVTVPCDVAVTCDIAVTCYVTYSCYVAVTCNIAVSCDIAVACYVIKSRYVVISCNVADSRYITYSCDIADSCYVAVSGDINGTNACNLTLNLLDNGFDSLNPLFDNPCNLLNTLKICDLNACNLTDTCDFLYARGRLISDVDIRIKDLVDRITDSSELFFNKAYLTGGEIKRIDRRADRLSFLVHLFDDFFQILKVFNIVNLGEHSVFDLLVIFSSLVYV